MLNQGVMPLHFRSSRMLKQPSQRGRRREKHRRRTTSPARPAPAETGSFTSHPPAPRPPRRAPSHLTRPPRARRDGLLSQVGYVEDFFEPRRKPRKERVPRAESWSWPARGWEGAIIVRGGRVYLSAVSASYEGRFSMMASSYVI